MRSSARCRKSRPPPSSLLRRHCRPEWEREVGCVRVVCVGFGLFCVCAGELEIASCIWLFPFAFLLVGLLHRPERKTRWGFVTGSPNKELAESLICKRIFCFFSVLHTIEVMDPDQWRSGAGTCGLGLHLSAAVIVAEALVPALRLKTG